MKLNNTFFEDLNEFVRQRISAVLYVSNGESAMAEIRATEITDTGGVLVEAAIEKTGIKIEELQLLGLNGHVWASQKTDITLNRSTNDAGVVFRIEINLKEAVTNV